MSELEDRLRSELNRRADTAPGGTLLAERIIAAARDRAAGDVRRHGWPTWTMPLLAAAAVAAIVAGVFVGVSQLRDTPTAHEPSIGSGRPTFATTAPSVTADPSVSPSSKPTRAATSSSATSEHTGPVAVPGFAIGDVTFVGEDDGWAIGKAPCLDGSGPSCDAEMRTTDGGGHWTSLKPPPTGTTGIRFATPETGYAYSPTALYLTSDGGTTWQPQKGGAEALETLDGNVIRVVSTGSGCPGPCGLSVEYAKIASPDWSVASLGRKPDEIAAGVQLVRSESNAYVLVTGKTAGGAGSATSTLYASTDDGAQWTARGEPCAVASGSEADSISIAASPGGAVTALCQRRLAGAGGDFVVTSTDSGAHFAVRPGTVPQYSVALVTGDPTTVLVAAGNRPYRSTDGGKSWSPIADVTGTASFVGFESSTMGRIVTNSGRTVWTTTDAGTSWTSFTFPS